MKKTDGADNRRSLWTALFVFGVIALLAFVPYFSNSTAAKKQSNQTQNPDEKFDYYDIRNDKNAAETLLSFRQTANRDAVENADVKDKFVAAESRLRQTVPTLKIEYNKELRNPEVIAPDVTQGRAFLTAPSNSNRAAVLRGFAKANNDLIALNDAQLDRLKVAADYTNPNGELSFARLEQTANGIPVFRSEIRAGFNKNGAMFRVINNLAPEIDETMLSTDFGDAGDAVNRAAGFINHAFKAEETVRNEGESTDLKAVFGQGDWATTAEKIYFPTEIGVARAAWRVLIWQPVNAYYVIVDAATGTMLYRENITADQSQAATYNVYANTTSILKTMPNPAPAASIPLNPALGTQGVLQPRTSVTFVGNEAPYNFNNLGWINDNANAGNGETDGNNVQAGVDRDTTNGVDATVKGTNRAFNFSYTPGAGANNSGGDSPVSSAYQNGAATNLFYVTNRYHDETYLLGFTEQARNFQNDNFGRGGNGADRISAEAQDNTAGTQACPTAPCYNNANFSTPADGSRGRMQMYLWSAMTPQRDGDLDAEIIVHELTHGLFGRLHNGVGALQSGQMNEGNSDFFGHVLLANATDPINSISTTGAYTSLNLRTLAPFSSTGNYYYGIRRFPKAVLAFTGGPNNRPHNPLTYADIDPAQMNLTNGAFAPAYTGSTTSVHDGGEIWSSMLWEIRARLVQRLGFEAGSRKVLQLVMDGMKVSPSNPSMMQERNAILAAALANGNNNDVGDIWAGFALRGLGANATNPTGNTVVENFELPNASLADSGFAVSDSVGGDGDGFAEPGETVQLTVPVINSTGNLLTNVTVTVTGGIANYGDIANGQTVTRTIAYQIPANAACGSKHIVTFTISSSNVATTTTQTRSFTLGKPVFGGTTQNFDSVTAPALPTGWTQENSGAITGWVTSTALTSSAPNAAFAPAPSTGGEASLNTSADITSASAQLNFKTFYNTEVAYDGMILEIQIGNGAFQEITAAGGSFASGGYNTTMDASSPFGATRAWSGNSTTFINTIVNLPIAANGQKVNLRWRVATDGGVAASGTPGVRIDDVALTGGGLLNGYECVVAPTAAKTKFDFDGDGKADVSVFRPSEGVWYLLNSNTGFTGAKFGQNGDRLAPADFDGDGKTDLTVFRNGAWYIQRSTAGFVGVGFGEASDVLQPADFDGDGRAEIAVFRPSNGAWYVYNLATGSFIGAQFGQSGDKPVVGDYDADGKADYAVFRPSNATWYINRSSAGFTGINFGEANDKPVPADYDGDGKTDVAVFRPSTGAWFIQRSTAGFTAAAFGQNGDVPAAADYDGDGKADIAVFRSGAWYMQRSTAGFTGVSFGVSADLPAPASFVQ